MNFIQALKIYNKENKSAWCVYRKGTTEYDAVIKIMKSHKKEVLPKLPKLPKKSKQDIPIIKPDFENPA